MANTQAARPSQRGRGESIFSKAGKFIKESYVETRYKSSWPTWTELRALTSVVIVALVVVAVYITVISGVLAKILESLQG